MLEEGRIDSLRLLINGNFEMGLRRHFQRQTANSVEEWMEIDDVEFLKLEKVLGYRGPAVQGRRGLAMRASICELRVVPCEIQQGA